MARIFSLRQGVSNDPNATPPSLKEVLDAALGQAERLMLDVLAEMHRDDPKLKVHRTVDVQHAGSRDAIALLKQDETEVAALFAKRLSDEFFHGGRGRSRAGRLSFNDLGLFGDDELSESVELARAQEEIQLAVSDVLPQLDAVMCTLMGWTTLQSGINPLRPEVYVRALQDTLSDLVPDGAVREALIVPAAGFMGVKLRATYREVTDGLRAFGVEPALPAGARTFGPGGTPMSAVSGTVAKTLLTLDKLRHLLLGDLAGPSAVSKAAAGGEFGHTVPASFEILQQLKQEDAVVARMERRVRDDASKAAARAAGAAAAVPVEAGDVQAAQRNLGRQLGDEVVRMMFDNLRLDTRLLDGLKQRLSGLEPKVLLLAQADSRFFSDRKHPARQFLDRITQRSLAYPSDAATGCAAFFAQVDEVLAQLAVGQPDAELFATMLAQLDVHWAREDEVARQRRADAAQALLHVEQRNLLAQRLAQGLEETLKQREVEPVVAEFLGGTWSLVMAEARLRSADGSTDPRGFEAVVEDLLWSVDLPRTRRNPRRLAAMIPGLLLELRTGLQSIDYPPELGARFFEALIPLHERVLEQRRGRRGDATAETLGADSLGFAPSIHAPDTQGGEIWVSSAEASESGFIPESSVLPDPSAEELAQAGVPVEPVAAQDIHLDSWIELRTDRGWVRAQLTWASPHGTLFMFTAASGAAHSMSRRTMERLLAQGGLRIVAEAHVVDQALDKVASAALRNSMKDA